MEKKTVHRISVRPIESSPHKKTLESTVCLLQRVYSIKNVLNKSFKQQCKLLKLTKEIHVAVMF